MQVKDIMSIHPECLAPEASIKDAALKMKKVNCGFLPICENDRLVGVITDRDIVIRGLAKDANLSTKAMDLMSPEVVYCFEDDNVDTAAAKMEDKRIRRLVVLNNNKRLVGILSIDDISAKSEDKSITSGILSNINKDLP